MDRRPGRPSGDLAAALDEARVTARSHGLALGAIGASEQFTALARRAGMRSLYLGGRGDVAAEMLAGRGLEEFSLNFATCDR